MCLLIPDSIARFISRKYGAEGQAWLEQLPEVYRSLAVEWSLSDPQPLDGRQVSLVYRVQTPKGPAVLKLGSPDEEFYREGLATVAFSERGGVKPIARGPVGKAILLPLIVPGSDLVELPDHEAVAAAASVMKRLRETPPLPFFENLENWFGKLIDRRADLRGMPKLLVDAYRDVARHLLDTTPRYVLLHGDLHHYNILRDGEGWTAIDPKGILGDPAYEPSNFLRNPLDLSKRRPDLVACMRERILGFAAELGYSAERIWAWGFAMSVLSAWWDEPGPGREATLRVVDAIAALEP